MIVANNNNNSKKNNVNLIDDSPVGLFRADVINPETNIVNEHNVVENSNWEGGKAIGITK